MREPETTTAVRFMRSGLSCPRRAAGRHPYTVLSYQIAGEVDFEQNGPLTIRGGDLHVIPAGQAHRVTRAVEADIWSVKIATAGLDRERFAPVLDPLEAMARGAVPRVTVPPSRRGFVASLFTELADARPGAALRTESLLALLLGELGAHAPPALPTAPPADLAARAIALIASRALGPLSLENVAQALGRHRSHVAEVVRRATGHTVGELIAEVRLEEARRRLEESDELVEVIGERVGYTDATHFARMFTRRYGVAPRAWRRGRR